MGFFVSPRYFYTSKMVIRLSHNEIRRLAKVNYYIIGALASLIHLMPDISNAQLKLRIRQADTAQVTVSVTQISNLVKWIRNKPFSLHFFNLFSTDPNEAFLIINRSDKNYNKIMIKILISSREITIL